MRLALKNTGSEDRAVCLGAWTRATFFDDPTAAKFCADRGIAVKAQSEGVNTAGGFLVPDQLAGDIIANRAASGLFRARATVRTMTSDIQSVPLRTGGATVTFQGENLALDETDVGFGSIGLKAQKVNAYIGCSTELLEDYSVTGAFLAEEGGAAMAAKEDAAGFNGDGTSAHGGMIGVSTILADGNSTLKGAVQAASGHDTFQELDAADLAAVVAGLPEQHHGNARWICSAYAQGHAFARLGVQVFGTVQSPTGPRPLMAYQGYPIDLTPQLPGSGDQSGKLMIAFGDLRASSILGARRELVMRASFQRNFEKDQILFRVTERFSIVNHGLGDADTAGALVGLVGS